MLVNGFKNLAKHLNHRKAYPQARISFGSRVTGGSRLGAEVSIEKDCYLTGSTLGDHVQIKEGCRVFNSRLESHVVIYPQTLLADVEFGSFSYVNEHSRLARVKVGRFASIGPQFFCGYGEHPVNLVSTSPVFYSTHKQCGETFSGRDYFEERKSTDIGHDVWIGTRVFVRDGVRIGHGAVVAAGASVVKDVPDYAIVGGVPAKIIRLRFDEEIIAALLEIEWWKWSAERLRAAQPHFVSADVAAFVRWAKENQSSSTS